MATRRRRALGPAVALVAIAAGPLVPAAEGYTADTEPATSVGQTTAVLRAHVTVASGDRGVSWWEYSRNGGVTWRATPPSSYGPGTGTSNVNYPISYESFDDPDKPGLVPDVDYRFRLVTLPTGSSARACWGPSGPRDCAATTGWEAFHTLGGVVRADYGKAVTATDEWTYKSDAWAFNGLGNDTQIFFTAGNPDRARSGGFRTLRTLGTRTTASAPTGSTELRVTSTGGFPTSCDNNGTVAPCGLLVGYTTFTNGQRLRYTGISGNKLTGVTGLARPVGVGALVMAQSAFDANEDADHVETRTQLINNSCSYPGSTFYCYPTDSRSVTRFWLRLQSPSPIPAGDDVSGGACQSSQVAQIKEWNGSGSDPVFGIVQTRTKLFLIVGDVELGIPRVTKAFPRPTGANGSTGWMRVGVDIRFSANPQVGKFQFLFDADANGTYEHVSTPVTSRTLLIGSTDEWSANLSFGPYQAGCVPPVRNDYANWEVVAKPLNATWRAATG